MSRGGLSDRGCKRLDAVLSGHSERADLPGAVALVQRGPDTFVHVSGHTALDAGRPLARNDIFRIASMTKPITALAALQLVEDCVLRLDDPVDRFLPELADRRVIADLAGPLSDTVPAARAITLRDLLTFRSGYGLLLVEPGTSPLADAYNDPAISTGPPFPDRVVAPDDWIARLGALPLVHQPGERWMYNTGSDILGVLIARASGRGFDRYLAERIFDPLGMVDTGFFVPEDQRDRLVTAYWNDPSSGDLVVFDPPAGMWSHPPAFGSGSGGLVSTLEDYARLGRLLLGGGQLDGVRLVSRHAVALMTADQLTGAQKAVSGLMDGMFDAAGWGMGVGVVTALTQPYHSVGAYGWNGGLGTMWDNDPVEGLTMILLTQRAFSSPTPPTICDDFLTAAYSALED